MSFFKSALKTWIGLFGFLLACVIFAVFLTQFPFDVMDFIVLVVLLIPSAALMLLGKLKFDKKGSDISWNKQLVNTKAIDTAGKMATSKTLEDYFVANPSIRLMSGEYCYYQGSAKSYNEKNVVVGRQSNGGSTSYRIGSVRVSSGGSGSLNIRGNVAETYNGVFYLTNKRAILTAVKFGFVLKLSDILSVSIDTAGGIMFFANNKSYTVLTEDIDTIKTILNLIELPEASEETDTSVMQSNSYIKELKELKELLDSGVITQEEFNAKKEKLLSL